MTVRLLLPTDLALASVDEIVRRAATVADELEAGTVVFGVRDHAAPARVRLELARALLAVARPRGGRVVVHDRVDLALAARADGVQLGERSVPVRDARSLLGAGAWIGRSCHDREGLLAAARDGADAATLSPLFASPRKGAPLGVERFAELCASTPGLTIIALGGVDASNAQAALDAGAHGVAAIRAWLVDDPRALCRAVSRAR